MVKILPTVMPESFDGVCPATHPKCCDASQEVEGPLDEVEASVACRVSN